MGAHDDPAREVADAIRAIRAEGRIGILLVEQYLDFCIDVGDRFYAMDRDHRWERVKKAYDLLVGRGGARAASAIDAVRALLAEWPVASDEAWNTAFGDDSLYHAFTRTTAARGVHAANRAVLLATRSRLARALRSLGFDVVESQANFVWCTHPSRPHRPIYEALKSRRILVRLMNYPGWGDGLRITVGTDAEIDTFLAALRGNN